MKDEREKSEKTNEANLMKQYRLFKKQKGNGGITLIARVILDLMSN